MGAKEDYDKGYADGRQSNDIPTWREALDNCISPGSMPHEKGEAYERGHEQGKSDKK